MRITKIQSNIWLVIVLTLAITNIFTLGKIIRHASCETHYSFINTSFSCGHKKIVNKGQYSVLKSKLISFIEAQKEERKVDMVSVWFRDLDGGPTLGINERVDFIPASLLKLPLVLTLFELAERDPEILKVSTGSDDHTPLVPKQNFIPSQSVSQDRLYTIAELIDRTIIYSDNLASQILFDYLRLSFPGNLLAHTYRDLGILDPSEDFNKAAVNTKEYGSIFRQLYNVSFLNEEFSERLLRLLIQANFKEGLLKGVPEDIKVAHKFGERVLENGEKQLHDCGIVYYPGNPYLLCTMTRGWDFAALSDIMGKISKEVYQEFDSRKLD